MTEEFHPREIPSDTDRPILYSFRRCPYAMRARMALVHSGVEVRLREVVLRDKPTALLEASPKATVPVLVLAGGQVLEESIEIMRWALQRADPESWTSGELRDTARLIAQADGPFKSALDRYKYANRYEGTDPIEQRARGVTILAEWDELLAARGGQLMRPERSLADVALFPFVRQFANVKRSWFDALPLPALRAWLAGHLESPLFRAVMHKYPQWQPGDAEQELPPQVAL